MQGIRIVRHVKGNLETRLRRSLNKITHPSTRLKKFTITLVLCLVVGCGFLFSQGNPRTLDEALIRGVYPRYDSATTVTITEGYGYCNGKFFELSSDFVLDLSVEVIGGDGFIYIYVDFSESKFPKPEFYGSRREPRWKSANFGYYDRTDRCIGVVTVGNNGIPRFSTRSNGNEIEQNNRSVRLVSAARPTKLWRWKDVNSSPYLPINAIAIRLHCVVDDPGRYACMYVSSKDYRINEFRIQGGVNSGRDTGGVLLGPFRDISWTAYDDDRYIYIDLYGWKIKR